MWPVKTSLFDIILIWLFELIIEKISLEIVSLYLNSFLETLKVSYKVYIPVFRMMLLWNRKHVQMVDTR